MRGWRAFGQWSQSEQGTEKQQPQRVRVLTAAGEVGRDVLGTRLGNEVPSRSCSRVRHLVQERGALLRSGASCSEWGGGSKQERGVMKLAFWRNRPGKAVKSGCWK